MRTVADVTTERSQLPRGAIIVAQVNQRDCEHRPPEQLRLFVESVALCSLVEWRQQFHHVVVLTQVEMETRKR